MKEAWTLEVILTINLRNESPVLSKIKFQLINMRQHPKDRVNESRKGVLYAPDPSKFIETPCIIAAPIV